MNPIFKTLKSRYWSIICYPESLPENWINILSDPGNPVAISPLHDSDIVTRDDIIKDPTRHFNYNEGDLKKSHYHVLIAYSGPTTGNNVEKLYGSQLNSSEIIPFINMKIRFEYLIHLNDPDKFQYNVKDIIYLNNFCINDYIIKTDEEKNEIIKTIIYEIWNTKICRYQQLIDFYLNDYDKFKIIKENCYFFTQYLKSSKLDLKNNEFTNDERKDSIPNV